MRPWLVVLCVASCATSTTQSQTATNCTSGSMSEANTDLYCIELLSPLGKREEDRAIADAAGTARLLAPSSPFGVAVTPAGEHVYDVLFTLRDLPPPRSL